MTDKEKWAEIAQAWIDGKTILYDFCSGSPATPITKVWDKDYPPGPEMYLDNFRVKPEPKYIPHNALTAPPVWERHRSADDVATFIVLLNDYAFYITIEKNQCSGHYIPFESAFDHMDDDGKPYGQPVE